jgi:hypothetical protein
MAKKTKYFAIDPQGETHTRTTARTYTHAVVVKLGRAYAAQQLARRIANTRKQAPKDFAFYLTMIDGTWYTRADRPAALGKGIPDWMTPAQREAEIADYTKRCAGCTTPEAYAEHALREVETAHAAQIAEGYYDKFGAAGWCGRRDLAEKLAAKERGNGYEDVVILEAQT